MSSHGRRFHSVAAAVVAALMLALAGCASAQPGQAAVVGSTRIAESTIADQVRTLNEATGKPADEPNADGAVQTVNYNIAFELVRQAAQRTGVTVSQGQADRLFAEQVRAFGDEEQLRQAAAQEGLSPDLLRGYTETQLLVRELVTKLAPTASEQEQSALLQQLLATTADDLGVQVAPKYGAWDNAQAGLVPLPDPVSKPESTTSPTPTPAPSP